MSDATRAAPTVDCALERPAQCGELALAADQRSVEPPLERRRDRRYLDEAERLHGLALALDLEQPERLESRRVVDQPAASSPTTISSALPTASSRAAIPTASPVTRR